MLNLMTNFQKNLSKNIHLHSLNIQTLQAYIVLFHLKQLSHNNTYLFSLFLLFHNLFPLQFYSLYFFNIRFFGFSRLFFPFLEIHNFIANYLLFISIMRATLNNFYNPIFNFINNSVSNIYSSAPITAQVIFQSFWLTNSYISISINIFYKFQYSLKNLLIIFCPIFKFFPCFISPCF